MNILLLNSYKSEVGLYEVLEYESDVPSQLIIHAVDGDGLVKISERGLPMDFRVSERAFLYGSEAVASECISFARPQTVTMKFSYCVYDFLYELLSVCDGSYFLRLMDKGEKIYYVDKSEVVDGYADVSSLRVSSSSMFIGVSYRVAQEWRTLVLVNSVPSSFGDNGCTVIQGDYRIAIDVTNSAAIALCDKYCSKKNCTVVINGRTCQLYSKPKLTIYRIPTPVEFYPLCLAHYLNFWRVSLHHMKALVKDGMKLDEQETLSDKTYYSSEEKRIAVAVSSPSDKFSRHRRSEIISHLSRVRQCEANLDDISLSSVERIASKMLLSELNSGADADLQTLYRNVRVLESQFSLALMRLRVGMLYFPYCFGAHTGGRQICYGGEGVMSGFSSYLDLINPEGRKVWNLAAGKLVPYTEG